MIPLLAAVAGGAMLKNMMDYPSEIRNLRSQMPKDERKEFIKDYKNLPHDTKTQFKKYLREANLTEAGKLIGRDLSGYTVAKKTKGAAEAPAQAPLETVPEIDFNTRIQNILKSYPLDSDPQLVAEAAKRYESIAGYDQMGIVDKTRKILDVSQ